MFLIISRKTRSRSALFSFYVVLAAVRNISDLSNVILPGLEMAAAQWDGRISGCYLEQAWNMGLPPRLSPGDSSVHSAFPNLSKVPFILMPLKKKLHRCVRATREFVLDESSPFPSPNCLRFFRVKKTPEYRRKINSVIWPGVVESSYIFGSEGVSVLLWEALEKKNRICDLHSSAFLL